MLLLAEAKGYCLAERFKFEPILRTKQHPTQFSHHACQCMCQSPPLMHAAPYPKPPFLSVSKGPLILVLTGGGPLDVSFAKGDAKIASILWAGYPGEGGGKALAQVVFGDYNKESFAKIPMHDMNMRVNPSRRYPGRTYRFYTEEPIHHFGHGLSYTDYTNKLLSTPNRLSFWVTIERKPASWFVKEHDGVIVRGTQP
ncbi:hypothetical protein Cgig2_007593 [Carnegiea gigantea]|uniref:Glycoside hydrolase family 3 C-terminal domain-containing protein n=1 Tax=Carnegiea gigantea TaxID=171969 RepID=A0A9Q1JZP9_9CARY|nr:hypothetical protein Cgig2_007593 [Carnegiea gigantea]